MQAATVKMVSDLSIDTSNFYPNIQLKLSKIHHAVEYWGTLLGIISLSKNMPQWGPLFANTYSIDYLGKMLKHPNQWHR